MFTHTAIMMKLDDAKTTDLLDGDLALAYERLQAEYAPKGP
jgi:hypothetical protein